MHELLTNKHEFSLSIKKVVFILAINYFSQFKNVNRH